MELELKIQRFSVQMKKVICVHKNKMFGTLLCTLTHYITVIYSYESYSENSKFRCMVVNNLHLLFLNVLEFSHT